MKKNILSLVITTVICASVMLAVIGLYRLLAAPILKAPDPPKQAIINIL